MSIPINRAYITQSFKTLNAYANGETVDADKLARARNPRHWTFLVGDYTFAFYKEKAKGDYCVVMPDAAGGLSEVKGSLGGIAVGNELIVPTDLLLPGTKPFVLIRLMVPEPSYNIDLSGKTGFGTGRSPQTADEIPAYLKLSEGAISVPGRPEEEQPLQAASGMKLRTLASRELLYFPPSYPIAPPTI